MYVLPKSTGWFAPLMTVLVVSVSQQSSVIAADNLCVFNSTHCSCRKINIPGMCLRHQRDNYCIVDDCSSNGMVCDCLADEICKRIACGSWISTNTSVSVNNSLRGTWISCRHMQDSFCLTRIEQEDVLETPEWDPPSSEQRDALSPAEEAITGNHPRESAVEENSKLHMVQVRTTCNSTKFNITAFVDKGDLITSALDMDEMWQNNEYLRRRFITMRLYDSPMNKERMLCAIYNKYGMKDDELGNMSVLVQISGTAGQPLQWSACNDHGECEGKQQSVLSAHHSLSSDSADGWCVKPLEWNGSGIRVKFSLVNGMVGLAFQSAGKTIGDRAFLFKDITEIEQQGYLNQDGLVVGGVVPDILFNIV